MTPEFRSDVITYLDTFIIANGNKEITGPQVNEAIAKVAYSSFFQLDEPRAVAASIAFVHPAGDDLTAQLGDLSRPYGTIQAGIDAVPSFGQVWVLGDSYIENLVVNKSNINISMNGIQLTGRLVKQPSSDVAVSATNSQITSTDLAALIVQSGGITVTGGTWTGIGAGVGAVEQQASGGGAFFGCTFRSDNTICVVGDGNAYFESCNIESTANVGAQLTQLSSMKNCRVVGATNGLVVANTTVKLDNCYIEGGNNGVTGQNTNDFDCNVIAFNRTRIKGLNGYGIRFLRNCEKVSIENCTISGTTDAIEYFNDVKRLNNAVNVFNGNTLFAGSGELVKEGVYDVADTGTALFTTSVTNVAFTAFTKGSHAYTETNANLNQVD